MDSDDKANYIQAKAQMEIYYILVATFFCILPMVADLLFGLCTRNFRFPSKCFNFYAAIITSMTVSLRLPMTAHCPKPNDHVAKLESMARMAFMSTMVANMLPSLGSMDSNTLLSNVIAYPFPTIMVIVFSCLEPSKCTNGHVNLAWIQVAMLVFLLVILISAAITIPSIKKNLEYKYDTISRRFPNDQHPQDTAALEKLKKDVELERYKIMAENGNPEYVMASGMISICGLVIYIYVLVEVLRMSGSYRWCSMVTIESIGVIVGSIAPICRCFMAANFESSTWCNKKHLAVFEVEEYWTESLYAWCYNSTFRSSGRSRKMRYHILNLLIGFQIGIVETCKIIAFIPIAVLICITYSLFYLKSSKEMWFAPPSRE